MPDKSFSQNSSSASSAKSAGGVTPVSSGWLKLSYWYISNKLKLRTALIVILILTSVGFYGYSFYRLATILFIHDPALQQSLNNLTANEVDYTHFHRANQPQALQIVGFDATDGREGRYDFIVKLKNPNTDFYGKKAVLQLLTGTTVLAEKDIYILPGQERFAIFFGQAVAPGVNPVINIKSVDWARVRQFADLAATRFNFTVTDVEFTPAGRVGSDALEFSTLNFNITNNTAFDFWQVGVYMVLNSGNGAAAANFIALDQFLSGQTKPVEIRFYENLSGISTFEILPEVNILDDNVYMANN